MFDSYAQYYLHDVYFTCALGDIKSLYIDQDQKYIHAIVAWNCKGYIDIVQTDELSDTDILVAGTLIINTDFQTQLDHQISVKT